MPQIRQLAVIMFTDIVGYTSLMEQNEEDAISKLNLFRTELQLQVGKYQGTIIQYFGDGGLIIFTNSSDAVSCAYVLQARFVKDPVVPLRIGLHLGDIVIKEGNIFGNCVNVASRIESMGVSGSVLISEAVSNELKNKPQFKLQSLGKFDFKNVEEPMEIFSLVIEDGPVINRNLLQGKFKDLKTMNSIAVLPFVNMSNDPEQEYFSDGMAEEIINSITHLKDVNVAGRTSSFQFKGKDVDIKQVGEKLSVSTVLEGSVRKQGNQLRITAQLINVEDGFHLWSEKYDRQLIDVFAIQDEIAHAITEKLSNTFLKRNRPAAAKHLTQNTEAYELYLKGKFHLARRGSSLMKSIQCFQKAIELDPGFALAHSGHADANFLIATYGLMAPSRIMEKARMSAERALQLDPYLCEPYCSLGYYYTTVDWNWQKAKEKYITAIELNPRFAEGHMRYAWTYLACVEGDFVKAEKHGKQALNIEPLSAICHANHSLILENAGKYQEAVETCRTGIDIDPNSFVCHLNLATALSALQKYDEAIPVFDMAMKLSNRHSFSVNALLWTYCLKGDFDKANDLMRELKIRLETEYAPCAIMAVSSAYLGDLNESISYLQQAYEDRDPMIILLKYAHWVPGILRTDPQFNAILNNVGFPELYVKN